MPSIAVSFKPYEVRVFDAPVMGSFADMWGVRQESDIVFEDGTQKSCINTLQEEHATEHTIKVTTHNPYSLTQPVTQVYACNCAECQGHSHEGCAAMMIDEPLMMPEDDAVVNVPHFMPAPPPRVDTYDVIAACGAVDPDSIVFNMMMRWFSKVSRIQEFFDVDIACPAPSPAEYNFSDWCVMVNEWWVRNFEHRQKRQSAATAPHRHGASNPHW